MNGYWLRSGCFEVKQPAGMLVGLLLDLEDVRQRPCSGLTYQTGAPRSYKCQARQAFREAKKGGCRGGWVSLC